MNIIAVLITVILTGIWMLYNTQSLTLPCKYNLLETVLRSFIHVDILHLIFNLIAFWNIVRQSHLGNYQLLFIVSSLIVMTTIGELVVNQIIPLTCSIGWSGIVLGLLAYTMLSKMKKWDWKILLYLVFISVRGPSNVSISGHLIGVFSGILLYGITSQM